MSQIPMFPNKFAILASILGGKTFNYTDYNVLTLNRSTQNSAPCLLFSNNSGVLGHFEAKTDGSIEWWNNKSEKTIPLNFGCSTASELASLLGGLDKLVAVWKSGELYPDGHNDHNLPCQYGVILRANVYTKPCILTSYDCTQVWIGCGNTTSGYPDSWTKIK